MICNHCKIQDHETCKEENKDKTPSSCDCQHRTYQKSIIQGGSTHQIIVAPVTFTKPGT